MTEALAPAGGPRIKICGITDQPALEACIAARVAYVGLVFFQKSPRHLDLPTAAVLARTVPAGIAKVALTVNAGDAQLDELVAQVPLDVLQLHGSESPDRVAHVRARYGLPVMKAVGLADAADFAALDRANRSADMVLVDAKPPRDATLPGGNGLVFDWSLIAGRRWPVPWMLAGGLTPDNVAAAVQLTGAPQIDVSSGVETAQGRKDPERIAAFCAAARAG